MNYYRESSLGGTDLYNIYRLLETHNPDFLSSIIQLERPEQELVARFIPSNSVVLELGGNYGATAAIINTKLSDKTQHVIVEPEAHFVNTLQSHRGSLNLHYTTAHGILAKDKEKQVKLWPSCANSRQFVLSELENMIGGSKFTAILADCEGAFDPILQDFPELLDTIKVIVLENDGGDIQRVRTTLQNANFTVVHSQIHPYWDGNIDSFNRGYLGFHEVWMKIN